MKNIGRVKPGLRTKGFFTIMRIVQKNGWNEADVRYWKEKGWTEQVRPWKKSRKGESHDRKNEQSVG